MSFANPHSANGMPTVIDDALPASESEAQECKRLSGIQAIPRPKTTIHMRKLVMRVRDWCAVQMLSDRICMHLQSGTHEKLAALGIVKVCLHVTSISWHHSPVLRATMATSPLFKSRAHTSAAPPDAVATRVPCRPNES